VCFLFSPVLPTCSQVGGWVTGLLHGSVLGAVLWLESHSTNRELMTMNRWSSCCSNDFWWSWELSSGCLVPVFWGCLVIAITQHLLENWWSETSEVMCLVCVLFFIDLLFGIVARERVQCYLKGTSVVSELWVVLSLCFCHILSLGLFLWAFSHSTGWRMWLSGNRNDGCSKSFCAIFIVVLGVEFLGLFLWAFSHSTYGGTHRPNVCRLVKVKLCMVTVMITHDVIVQVWYCDAWSRTVF